MGSPEEYSKSSRLCRGLDEIVRDHEAVPYLIQYLESCKAAAVLRFWLDAESFQASTWTRIRTHSLQSVSKSSLVREKEISSESLSKSINKDITSPMSLSSLDSIPQENQSKSSEALTQTVAGSDNGNKHSCDSEQETSVEFTNETAGNQSENSISDRSSLVVENEQAVTESCDSRDREKCKTEIAKGRFSLTLSQTNCDSRNQSTQSAELECAISYRDITTPSPTESSTAQENSVKSGTSTQSKNTSSTSLAEKLKKSKHVSTVFTANNQLILFNLGRLIYLFSDFKINQETVYVKKTHATFNVCSTVHMSIGVLSEVLNLFWLNMLHFRVNLLYCLIRMGKAAYVRHFHKILSIWTLFPQYMYLTGVEQDAVRIFTKYLAQEATHPIGVTDDLRNDTIRKWSSPGVRLSALESLTWYCHSAQNFYIPPTIKW